MSLIAKFDCQDNSMVLCADSQETAGDYRVEVKKIEPRPTGNYELTVGGSGYVGELIDGMTDEMMSALSRLPAAKSESEIKQTISNAVLKYHRNQVKNYPIEEERKRMEFIVCLRDTVSSRIFSWRIGGTAVNKARRYELLGWEPELYHQLVKPFLEDDSSPLPIQQAIVLGLRLFMLVEKSSLYVDEPTSVVVLTPSQSFVEPQSEVSAMRKLVAQYDEMLRDLVMSCADTSIAEPDLRAKIKNFEESAIKLHNAYIAAAGTRTFWSGKMLPNDLPPYLRWPLGTAFTMHANGHFTAKQMSNDERGELRRKMRDALEMEAKFKRVKPSESQKSEPEQ